MIGTTIHRQAVMRAVKEFSEEHPAKWDQLLGETQRKLAQGFWAGWYVDVIGQKFGDSTDIFDAFAFLQVHCDIYGGDLAMVQVEVGRRPENDRALEANNAALAHLPSPFKAEFLPERGGGADADGYVTWTKPVQMMVYSTPNKAKRVTVKPWTVPLEVGFTEFSKTLIHVRTSRLGVARWPYGSELITVLYRTSGPAFDRKDDQGRVPR